MIPTTLRDRPYSPQITYVETEKQNLNNLPIFHTACTLSAESGLWVKCRKEIDTIQQVPFMRLKILQE